MDEKHLQNLVKKKKKLLLQCMKRWRAAREYRTASVSDIMKSRTSAHSRPSRIRVKKNGRHYMISPEACNDIAALVCARAARSSISGSVIHDSGDTLCSRGVNL